MDNSTIETLWGIATLEKKIAHYSRLRVGQLKSRMKRHKARLDFLDKTKVRLYELGITKSHWTSSIPGFDQRRRFEEKLYIEAKRNYQMLLDTKLSGEQQKQAQLAFAKVAK